MTRIHTCINVTMEDDACTDGKHAFPSRAHVTIYAHNQTDAIAAYAYRPSSCVLPLVSHASTAVFPLLIFGLVCWVTLALRRSPKKQQWTKEDWVRPLSNVAELVSAVGALCGTFNITNVVWLTSTQPITQQLVRHALTQVAQNVELLRLAVAWRRLWPWYRRMKHLNLDFSVDTDDPLAVCTRMLHVTYDVSEGPLWRACLVPMSPLGPGQHRAALVISCHHVITDGTTNLIIIKDLLHALNAAATGCRPRLSTRLLVPALSSSAAASRNWLPSLGFVLSASCAAFTSAFSRQSVLRHLPQPGPGKPITRFLRHEFSAETTKQLLAQCRASGVRVHSCITAAAGLALHRTAQQFVSRRLDALQVFQEQAVNMRRYHPQHSDATGSIAFLTIQRHNVSDGPDNFWPLARTIQAELDRNLEVTRSPQRTSSLGWLCSAIIPINFLLARLGFTSFSYSHICSSNMGDLRRLLGDVESTEGGGPVQLDGLFRSTAAELAGSMCCLNCHTLKDRLTLSLDYFTNKMTEAAAETFFTHLTHTLTELAATGYPPPSYTPRACNGNG